MPYGLAKFKRFAVNVWSVETAGKTDEQIAEEGLLKMEEWMKSIGAVLSIKELGADESMLEKLADATMIFNGGYKVLNHSEIVEIFKQSL